MTTSNAGSTAGAGALDLSNAGCLAIAYEPYYDAPWLRANARWSCSSHRVAGSTRRASGWKGSGSDGTRARALPPRFGSERDCREPSVCQTFDSVPPRAPPLTIADRVGPHPAITRSRWSASPGLRQVPADARVVNGGVVAFSRLLPARTTKDAAFMEPAATGRELSAEVFRDLPLVVEQSAFGCDASSVSGQRAVRRD
jgi:hypothetical protein